VPGKGRAEAAVTPFSTSFPSRDEFAYRLPGLLAGEGSWAGPVSP
jgi:hypothetical protein